MWKMWKCEKCEICEKREFNDLIEPQMADKGIGLRSEVIEKCENSNMLKREKMWKCECTKMLASSKV